MALGKTCAADFIVVEMLVCLDDEYDEDGDEGGGGDGFDAGNDGEGEAGPLAHADGDFVCRGRLAVLVCGVCDGCG